MITVRELAEAVREMMDKGETVVTYQQFFKLKKAVRAMLAETLDTPQPEPASAMVAEMRGFRSPASVEREFANRWADALESAEQRNAGYQAELAARAEERRGLEEQLEQIDGTARSTEWGTGDSKLDEMRKNWLSAQRCNVASTYEIGKLEERIEDLESQLARQTKPVESVANENLYRIAYETIWKNFCFTENAYMAPELMDAIDKVVAAYETSRPRENSFSDLMRPEMRPIIDVIDKVAESVREFGLSSEADVLERVQVDLERLFMWDHERQQIVP